MSFIARTNLSLLLYAEDFETLKLYCFVGIVVFLDVTDVIKIVCLKGWCTCENIGWDLGWLWTVNKHKNLWWA